jgi:acetyl/propionyl-CoA carboxylase alpha subunit
MSKLAVTIDGIQFEVELDLLPQRGNTLSARVDGQDLRVILPDLSAQFEQIEWLIVDDHPYEIAFDPDLRWIKDYTGLHSVKISDLGGSLARPVSRDSRVKSPIPGQITRVFVAPGQTVEIGQPLFILEAMKMQNEICAQRSGSVHTLHVKVGDIVAKDVALCEIT